MYEHRLGKPVLSTAVLLRPEADGPAMTGKHEMRVPGRPGPYRVFEYDVLRLWQLPVAKLLAGGIGILPLAPLADDAAARLPEVLGEIDRRLRAEAIGNEAEKLRAATSVLMSLRHPPGLIRELMKGMWPMWKDVLEDSSIVKEFVQRGEERGVKIGEERASARFRDALLRLGEKRLGPPDPASRAAIEKIADPDRLATLSERVLDGQAGKSCWRNFRTQARAKAERLLRDSLVASGIQRGSVLATSAVLGNGMIKLTEPSNVA